MPESFGDRLRQRRVEQNIALSTIADQTKIKLSLLEALERDDLSRWPGGIFRRAFVRAYAHAIGLNPDAIVKECLALYPDPDEVVVVAPAVPPTGLRSLVGSALGSLPRFRQTSPLEDVAPAPERVAADVPVVSPPPSETDFLAVARLCTELGRVEKTDDVHALLQEAAGILDAIGVIVWTWDGQAMELRAALAHGYSDQVLAQLPSVRRDADNATAAAFRSGQVCTIAGGGQASGALVAPLLTSWGCAGVLAMELSRGREQTPSVRAAVTILAAQLSQLMGAARAADAPAQAEAIWKVTA